MIFIDRAYFIQEIRAIHALVEIIPDFCVSPNLENRISYLKKVFNIEYQVCESNLNCSSEIIKINHSTPFTQIFEIKKDLIFPKSMFVFLKSNWPQLREIEFSFSGFISSKRKYTLQNWMSKNFINDNNSIESFSEKMLKLLFDFLNIDYSFKNKIGSVLVLSSNHGRNFPIKSWDENYYNNNLNSKFVLCPSGDFIWTYRFFEAIICGAIPVVEEYCPLYEGFKFYYFNDNINSLVYKTEMADFNFKLAFERLTISKEHELKILRYFETKI